MKVQNINSQNFMAKNQSKVNTQAKTSSQFIDYSPTYKLFSKFQDRFMEEQRVKQLAPKPKSFLEKVFGAVKKIMPKF